MPRAHQHNLKAGCRIEGAADKADKAQDKVARVVVLSMARYANLVVPSLPLNVIDQRFASRRLQYGANVSASAIVITEEAGCAFQIGNHVHELMNAALLSLTLGLRLVRGLGAYTCGGLFSSTGLFDALPLLDATRELCPLKCPLQNAGARMCARAPSPWCSIDRDLGHGNFSLFDRPGAEAYHLRQMDVAGKFQSQEAAMSRRVSPAAAALFARAGGPHALYGRIFADFFRFREDRPALARALAALKQRRAAEGRGQVVTIAAQIRHRTSCQHGHEKVELFARAIRELARGRRCEVLLASDRRATFAALERALGNECALHSVERNNASQPGQFVEHGVDALETAAADLGLLARADHLVGTWGSTFTLLIQSLIANRFLRRGAVARGEPPVVVYCDALAADKSMGELQRDTPVGWSRCLRPLPLIANWHISLQRFPQIDLWVG